MTAFDEHGRPEPPAQAGEVDTVLGFLEFQRATLAWKTDGLDDDQLRRTAAESTMTFGGLLKHLAWVEDFWFRIRLRGEDWSAPWDAVDWTSAPDWEWTSAGADTGDDLRGLWRDAVVNARRITAEILTEHGPEATARPYGRDPSSPSLRWILVHLVEEYSRHNGHADFIREAIDGLVGE